MYRHVCGDQHTAYLDQLGLHYIQNSPALNPAGKKEKKTQTNENHVTFHFKREGLLPTFENTREATNCYAKLPLKSGLLTLRSLSH